MVGVGSAVGMFNVGDSVVATDLTAQPALNGIVGKVTGFDKASQRYIVKLASTEAPVKLKGGYLCLSVFHA